MGIFEVISAIILIIACVFIVVVVLMKDTKTQMSQTISGSSSESFYQKNAGRTKEAMLNKATIAAAIVFFVLALAVNVINVYWSGKNSASGGGSSSNTSVSDTSDAGSDSADNSGDTSENSEGSSDSLENDSSTDGSTADVSSGSGQSTAE